MIPIYVECACYPHRVEGVFYRIGQKLERYKLEPVAHAIVMIIIIANSKLHKDGD